MRNIISIGIKKLLSATIMTLRPLLGPAACRFPVGCTKYAIEQLASKSLWEALCAITKRLLLCNPLIGMFKN